MSVSTIASELGFMTPEAFRYAIQQAARGEHEKEIMTAVEDFIAGRTLDETGRMDMSGVRIIYFQDGSISIETECFEQPPEKSLQGFSPEREIIIEDPLEISK